MKTKFTLRLLHKEIDRHIQEKEELYLKIEEATKDQKTTSPEESKGIEKTLQALYHLPPLISIHQVYRATRGLTLMKSGLSYLQPGVQMTKEEFEGTWRQAQPDAKDTLAFMWAILDIKIPLGVMELISANPSFYISRYSIRALA